MSNVRLGILMVFFFLFGALIVSRLFSVQIKEAKSYQLKAARQQSADSQIERGDMFAQDKNGNLFRLATTQTFFRLYAIPSHIPEAKEAQIARELAVSLQMPEEIVRERLSKKDDPYEPLKERILPEEEAQAKKLTELFPEGLKLQQYKDRFYPYGKLASHILGFVGYQGERKEGLYGLEKFYESDLAQGEIDLVLSLDINIQRYIENTLGELLAKWNAPSGSITVMRPRDGAILAMAANPDFDPNHYQQVEDISYFINPVVQEVFEPGSIVKPITMAAGLEAGKITPETVYVDPGTLERGGYNINNAGGRNFGKRNMKEVLQFSINTGAIFVEELVGQKDFLRTFEKFGFGQSTDIDLPGEAVGDMTNLDTGRSINYATASFGQGISTTPLQILSALASVANGGKLMRPFVVERRVELGGKEISTQSEVRKVSMEEHSAANLVAMMVDVVQNGYDKKARVPGYAVAGKTGTSEVPEKGEYLEQTIHSFIGFAPAYKPEFIVLIKMDAPLGIRFASESIAPIFSTLTQYLLQYYQILPERAVQ